MLDILVFVFQKKFKYLSLLFTMFTNIGLKIEFTMWLEMIQQNLNGKLIQVFDLNDEWMKWNHRTARLPSLRNFPMAKVKLKAFTNV